MLGMAASTSCIRMARRSSQCPTLWLWLIAVVAFWPAVNSVHIASFNVHGLTPEKLNSDPLNKKVLSGIIGYYDIIVLSEVYSSPVTAVADVLKENLNSRPDFASASPWQYINSELLGENATTRQAYVVFYRKDRVTVLQTFQSPIDNYRVFAWPPFSVKFSSSEIGQFFCMAMHTHSVRAFSELQALSNAFNKATQMLGTQDGLILGDLNVGRCGTVAPSEWAGIPLWTNGHFRWFINEDESTSTLAPRCSSDRFISTSALASRIPGSRVAVFYFDKVYQLTKQQALQISTHYPIELEIIQPEPNVVQPEKVTKSVADLNALYAGKLGCGYILNTEEGALTDGSGVDVDYRNNLNCIWIILVPVGYSITLRVKYQFEDYYEDRLEIRDGYKPTSRLIQRLQGKGVAEAVHSTSNVLYLQFNTDSSGTSYGFLVTYTSSPLCEHTLTTLQGTIQSPVNPASGTYPKNTHCLWNIRLPLGMVVEFTFKRFEVEAVDDCSADYVMIVDGLITEKTTMPAPSSSALMQSQDTRTWQRLCGPILPQPLTSSSNQLGIMFHSDYTLSSRGFEATYRARNSSSCSGGQHFGGTRGVFGDGSGESGKYWNNWNCTYTITVPTGNLISLLFLNVDVEPSRMCQFDYIDVWDVGSGMHRRILRICGQQTPPAIASLSNQIELQFITDGSLQYGGFVASYRVCEQCPAGMYAELPCFDVFHGFCMKCSTCASDEYVVANCTALKDTQCAKKATFPLLPLQQACTNSQFTCQDGSCLKSESVCNGILDCQAGDDERYCACSKTDFQCNNTKCVPYYLHCNGINDCVDGSDEMNCGCSKDMFQCADRTCIPLLWRCDGEQDCANFTDEQGCQDASHSGDPCYAGNWPKFILRPSIRVTTVDNIRRCFNSIALKPSYQKAAVKILRDGLLDLYAYGDLVRNSSWTNAKLPLGLHYSSYNISIDLDGELTRIASTKYQSSYDFHTDLVALFTKFHDAHTVYVSPFSSILYTLPFQFGSVLVKGVQRITVNRVIANTFPAYYQVHKGPPFINFDEFSSEFLPKYMETPSTKSLITTINGVDALKYLKEASRGIPEYKDEGVRFNAYLNTALFSVGQYPLPSRDSVEIVFDDNSNLTVQYTAFVSVSGTNDLRPVLALQQDLKKLIKLAKEQADFEQFLYTNTDSPLSAQLLGKKRRRRQTDIYEEQPKILTPLEGTNFKNQSLAFYDSGTIIWKLTTYLITDFATPNGARAVLGTMSKIFDAAVSKKTDKLLIDLVGNGGGVVVLAYAMMAMLEPEWGKDFIALSEDYDIRISPVLQQIVANFEETHRTFPQSLSKADALKYILQLENFETSLADALSLQSGISEVVALARETILNDSMSDEARALIIHDLINTTLIQPVESSLIPFQPMSRSTNESISLSELVNNPVQRLRGGKWGNYSQKFALGVVVNYLNAIQFKPGPKVFNTITVLTDGTCGSACSQFLSKMMLAKKVVVVSYGGFHGQPMDTSAFAGGNVFDWKSYWPSGLKAVAASRLYLPTANKTAEDFGFSTPLPLPFPALTRFDFSEAYVRMLGPDSLPREWYRLPANIHLPVWAVGVNTWPAESQHSLLQLYRKAIAAAAMYRVGHVYQNSVQPCHYISKCRPHFHNLWSRASVSFLNVSLWRDNFLLFNNSSCSHDSLVLNSSRYATWTDLGLNPLKPSRLQASHVRRLRISAIRYDVIISDQRWLDVFQRACPCSTKSTWEIGVRRVITEASCPPVYCNIQYITFKSVFGNYILLSASHVYKSEEEMSADAGALSAINGDELFVLTTVFERCFPVTAKTPKPTPPADTIKDGTLNTITNQEVKGWAMLHVYLNRPYHHQWYLVCGDNWTVSDSDILCKQTTISVKDSSAGTETSSAKALNILPPNDELQDAISFRCYGNESALHLCPFQLFASQHCTKQFFKVSCDSSNNNGLLESSQSQLALGLGIGSGIVGLSIILVIIFFVRKARHHRKEFSENELRSMTLNPPRRWWRWTPLNKEEELDFSDQVNYTSAEEGPI